MERLHNLFLETTGISTDTRKISEQCMFIALKGENFDGNQFVKQAIQSGAKYAITSEKELENNTDIFYVEDTLSFLQNLANYHRKKFSIPVIGITGSNGKTTSKELIASVLQQQYKVLFTEGNLNNHIGVPLTLLKLRSEHEIAIIEMGASKPGDIKELVELAEPTHGIITNIGRAHLEGFGSLEGVIRTKSELYDFIRKNSGKIIINQDDPILTSQLGKYDSVRTYSGKKNGEVTGELIRLTPFAEFEWQYGSYVSPTLITHLVGEYNFYNFLAAITFGIEFDVPIEKINRGITEYIPSNNRSQVQKTEHNTLILDAYNANPTSMLSALESFDKINHLSKMVVLGDMLELGKESDTEHQKIVDYLTSKDWKVLVVGKEFQKTKFPDSILHFENNTAVRDYLLETQPRDKLILIKGSRGIKLETCVDAL